MTICLVAGSTGLVGSELLALLLDDDGVRTVCSLVRRRSGRSHPRLVEHVADFDDLSDHGDLAELDVPDRIHEVYCCLGTTMHAAGSRDAFRRVDHDYVVGLGRLAAAAGALSFALVSSVGADPAARSFYLRVKGETERDLRALGLPHLVVLRPSLLLGDRRETRWGERLAEVTLRLASPLLVGSLARYRPVHARTVARAMVAASRPREPGPTVLEGREIRELAASSVRCR